MFRWSAGMLFAMRFGCICASPIGQANHAPPGNTEGLRVVRLWGWRHFRIWYQVLDEQILLWGFGPADSK